ncbi:hypothetical protein [Sphingobium lignivorans]|uniref:Uncharacterized protein n=1 Tax=Sphingobium lignivorans TaxID=2735886 RepID=A0ABR6NJF8_9SPHN|nr:hypothetical protein [Sphingobium lignivorans]MBB5987415.1 hypothetical protein [Sphingobium lignivorans]
MSLATLSRFWWALPLLALLGTNALTRCTLADRTRALSDERKAHGQTAVDLAAERAAHKQSVANYRAAAETARAQDAANKARVEREQATINRETVDDYEARLAAARALAERLRADRAASARAGSAPVAPVPGTGQSAGRADEATCEDRLPFADALTATEQAIQLDALISWVQRQTAVDVGGEH